MKQNTNIFVKTAVIVLICGQLQGLSRKQFFKLDQLKQELNVRYRRGVPARGGTDWLEANRVIIEQMRKLDSPTAAMYQKKQKIFAQRVAQRAAVEEAEKQVIEPIKEKITSVKQHIAVELAKSPNSYGGVNFSGIFNEIEKISQSIYDVRNQITEPSIQILNDSLGLLDTQFADAVLTNLVRLRDPVIGKVEEVKVIIEDLQKSQTYFRFDKDAIGSLIAEIAKRLTAASQKNLLVSSDVMADKAMLGTWEKAARAAKLITNVIDRLLGVFDDYIEFLNERSQEDKNNDRLLEDHFDRTAQAILTVSSRVIGDLYSRLQTIFINGFPFIDDLTHYIKYQRTIFSELKTNLYNIYEVKEGKGSKITILYDPPAGPGGKTGKRKRSKDKDDTLAGIPPTLDSIVSGRPLVPEAKSFSMKELKELGKELLMEEAGILAEAIMGPYAATLGSVVGGSALAGKVQDVVQQGVQKVKDLGESGKDATKRVGAAIRELLTREKAIATAAEKSAAIATETAQKTAAVAAKAVQVQAAADQAAAATASTEAAATETAQVAIKAAAEKAAAVTAATQGSSYWRHCW